MSALEIHEEIGRIAALVLTVSCFALIPMVFITMFRYHAKMIREVPIPPPPSRASSLAAEMNPDLEWEEAPAVEGTEIGIQTVV